jgi:hypothetical protein
MQPRRIGSLLPLVQLLLVITAGCSPQAAEPRIDSKEALDTPTIIGAAPALPEQSPIVLHPVASLPALQQTPAAPQATDSRSEIVQARYRPAAINPSEAIDSKSSSRVEFGRAPDYGWLQGELLFSSVRGVWRLRYAAADDEDPYGGSVTLRELPPNLVLEAGQRVRVTGRLVNAGSAEPSPCYHVEHLNVLGMP